MPYNFLQPFRALVASLSFSSSTLSNPPPVQAKRLNTPLRIGILSCYNTSGVIRDKFGDFVDAYKQFLRDNAPHGMREGVVNGNDNEGKEGDGDYVFEAIDATAMHFPDETRLDEFDCFMITGSPASANDETEWVVRLAAFIARVAVSNPRIRFLGICFGHQIIARAMGGRVEFNGGTWEAGPTDMKLTEVGKRVLGADTDGDWTLQQVHRDHVVQLPPGFESLASSPITPIQGMVRFVHGCESSDDARPDCEGVKSSNGEIQFLTTQGHPEFSEDLTMAIVDLFFAEGIMDAETAAAAKAKRGCHVNSAGVGKAMWGVILQASKANKPM